MVIMSDWDFDPNIVTHDTPTRYNVLHTILQLDTLLHTILQPRTLLHTILQLDTLWQTILQLDISSKYFNQLSRDALNKVIAKRFNNTFFCILYIRNLYLRCHLPLSLVSLQIPSLKGFPLPWQQMVGTRAHRTLSFFVTMDDDSATSCEQTGRNLFCLLNSYSAPGNLWL